MRRILGIFLLLLLCLNNLAQDKGHRMVIHQKDGTPVYYQTESLDSITFVESEEPFVNTSDEIRVSKVFGDGISYCAFTSMINREGVYYLAFREGKEHVGDGDYGVIIIMKSEDGIYWEKWRTISSDGIDLRDPHLSKMPNGNILITCGARIKKEEAFFETKTYSTYEEGGIFTDIKEVSVPDDYKSLPCCWIWRVSWQEDDGYGILYYKKDNKYHTSLLKTKDGMKYETVVDFDIPGETTEGCLKFLTDKKMVALIRRGYSEKGYMGISESPYKEWQWKELPIYLAGHDFLFDDDVLLCSSRLSTNVGERTAIWYGDIEGSFQWSYLLPSSGKNSDTAYSSILKVDNSYWISYYSMHETAKPCIYLAKIPIRKLPYLK